MREQEMTSGGGGAGLLRARGERRQRVTSVELFFDLVYVFAVTQLSHLLLEHLTLHGAVQTLMLLLAVWWAWVYTAWFTNWFDPNQPAVRLTLVGVMLASLIMSATLPAAFAERGLIFAGAYVAMQVGRTAFVVAALEGGDPLRRNFQRILAWSVASGVLWLAGGLAEGTAREALWLGALAVDYAAPVCGFATPGLGRSRTTDWTIVGEHLAERCQLLIIVAFGESILVTGATFGGLPLSAATLTAFVVAFAGSVALWWIYFDRGAEASSEAMSAADDPGRLGRSAYTYFHLPMVAGIIVAAVGDELTIAHPDAPATAATTAVILGGPALYLAGNALFKWAVWGRLAWSRLVAIGALALLAPAADVLPALALAGAAALIVVVLAVWDTRTRWTRVRAAGGHLTAEPPTVTAQSWESGESSKRSAT
jgi:low temperature requirement protein LtrA